MHLSLQSNCETFFQFKISFPSGYGKEFSRKLGSCATFAYIFQKSSKPLQICRSPLDLKSRSYSKSSICLSNGHSRKFTLFQLPDAQSPSSLVFRAENVESVIRYKGRSVHCQYVRVSLSHPRDLRKKENMNCLFCKHVTKVQSI